MPPDENRRVALQEPIQIASQVKNPLQVPDLLPILDPLPITDSPQVPLRLLQGIKASIGDARSLSIYTTTVQEGFAEKTCWQGGTRFLRAATGAGIERNQGGSSGGRSGRGSPHSLLRPANDSPPRPLRSLNPRPLILSWK
ncbi:hypothetical protein MRX96_050005 [Rhipicephalus microplus]